jgi:hypothetical protein
MRCLCMASPATPTCSSSPGAHLHQVFIFTVVLYFLAHTSFTPFIPSSDILSKSAFGAGERLCSGVAHASHVIGFILILSPCWQTHMMLKNIHIQIILTLQNAAFLGAFRAVIAKKDVLLLPDMYLDVSCAAQLCFFYRKFAFGALLLRLCLFASSSVSLTLLYFTAYPQTTVVRSNHLYSGRSNDTSMSFTERYIYF